MKIVCISNNRNSLRDWDQEYYHGRLENITVGKVYTAENVDNLANPWNIPPYGIKVKGGIPETIDIYITNDIGKLDWLPYYLFEPLVISRDNKLKDLLSINRRT